MNRKILRRLVEIKELLHRKKHLKEKELIVSQAMGEKLKVGNPITRIIDFLLNTLVLWAVEIELATGLPATAQK